MQQETLDAYQHSAPPCPTCDRDDFKSSLGMKQHHKKAHGESISGVEATCDECGGSFRRKQSQLDLAENHLCSPECQKAFQTGQSAPAWGGGLVSVECTYCGSSFQLKPSRAESHDRHFCPGSDCHSNWQSKNRQGEDSPRYSRVTVQCAHCETEKEVPPSRLSREYHFCDNACRAEWRSNHWFGPDCPMWRGGKSVYNAVKHSLGPVSWERIAEQTRERYNYECQTCGVHQSELDRKLHVHHIVAIMSGGSNGEYNLLPFCPSCHVAAESFSEQFNPLLLAE